MKTSVASVTFRNKSKEEVVRLAVNARLDAIEWGGDIHVPSGDDAAAHSALELCRKNNLSVSAYGSYYSAKQDESFDDVLKTALTLETRIIRVWAGRSSSNSISAINRSAIIGRLKAACEKADEAGCVVATEYHADTLTDTLESTLALLSEVPQLKTLWQPPIARAHSQNLEELRCLLCKLENLHVYHRSFEGECRPLSEGADNWSEYIKLSQQCSSERFATLEFVKNTDEQQFLNDAGVLRLLIAKNVDAP